MNPPLTPRETEVLRILVRGRTNREIAAALGISVTTANFHVVSLIRKFTALNRTELTYLAAKRGLV